MKNKKAIILLFTANIISGLAQGISMIAIPWYFVEILNRPDVFAKSYLIITFLTLFWGVYAGTLIDRYSRKKLFIYINLLCGILIGSIAILGIYTYSLSDILVMLVFGITIFNYNVHYPNLYAFGQEITEPENYGRLNSYIEVQGQFTSVFAGAFAAILLTGTNNNVLEIAGISLYLPFNIKPWKIYEIFLLDSITYLCVILIFLMIKYIPVRKNVIHKGNIFQRFKQGLNYLHKNPVIFSFAIASYMLFAFTLVQIHVILPSYVSDFLKMGGNVYASAEIYYSFGAIFSGILILRIFNKLKTVVAVMILMLLVTLAFFSMFFFKVVWVFFIGNFILGITNAGIRILRTTYLFKYVPNNIIGRVNSVFNSLNIMIRMILIGILALPFFHIDDNIRFGYLLGAILLIIVIIFLLFWFKKIIDLDEN